MAVAIPVILAFTEVGVAAGVALGVSATTVAAVAGVAIGVTGIGDKINKAASKVFGEDLVNVANIAGTVALAGQAFGAWGGAGGAAAGGAAAEAVGAGVEAAGSAAEAAFSSPLEYGALSAEAGKSVFDVANPLSAAQAVASPLDAASKSLDLAASTSVPRITTTSPGAGKPTTVTNAGLDGSKPLGVMERVKTFYDNAGPTEKAAIINGAFQTGAGVLKSVGGALGGDTSLSKAQQQQLTNRTTGSGLPSLLMPQPKPLTLKVGG